MKRNINKPKCDRVTFSLPHQDTLTREEAEKMRAEVRNNLLKQKSLDEQKIISEAERQKIEAIEALKEQYQMIHDFKEKEIETLKKNLYQRQNSILDLEKQLKQFQITTDHSESDTTPDNTPANNIPAETTPSAEIPPIDINQIKEQIKSNKIKIKKLTKISKQEQETEKWDRLSKGKTTTRSDNIEESTLPNPVLKPKKVYRKTGKILKLK